CRDSSTIWAEVTASYIIDKEGNPAGFVGITRDISERKRAEESIRRSEETYRTIFESTGTAMAIIDRDGMICLANTEFQDLSGYTQEELGGKKSWKDFISPEDLDHVPTYLGSGTRETGTDQRNFDFQFLDRLGRKKYVFTTSTKIPVSEQTVVSLLDITDRKKDSEELKISQEHLRNLHKHSQDVRERERTRVAREIHDELGQVLTALKMDLSYLAKKLPAELPSLKTKTNLMLRFVDMTIQSVKRITMDLRPGLLDHLGLIAAIEWQAEEFQKRTGIRYTLSFDPDDMTLDPDLSTSVFRIFQETLTNIARHAHATEIKISLLEKDGALELTVADNGIGISKDQIENPKSFGLMGIRERTYFSGGEAKIFGQKGKGTIVSVSIPLP
ncbi:PAS domain-containing sensor histidine kinase, partial [bacterium]|nr:PAS domain-containing sensor histidine kinase [bacterium]